ncbi:substrate-binding domain-containing protein [Blautia segnis]|uniref:Substrate-binding domain-containing protein n=1 Tax=Blautia segnis TaxID=2763030 RepID=A0A8I0A7D9_9FIRM|nr:substrate-binding domain-containing protein [Blautia segnis]MBC5649809.1 substrate-binding domain-containing protein [Blautia segnis]
MKKRKQWILLFCIALTVCLASGAMLYVRQKNNNKKWSLIYIPKTEDGTNDFWTSLISGTRMAAQECGASLTILAPEREQDVERQNEFLAEAIEENPDAILFSPSSFDASDELLQEAKEKGIKITFIDSYTESNIQDMTVATDNLEAGKLLGEYARTLLNENSRIAIVSHVKGVSTAVEREQGFREGLGDYNKNVVEVVYCNSLFDKASQLTEALIEKYPDLEMVAGMNEYSAVGAARAVQKCGKEGGIQVVGVDSSQEAVQLMEKGVFKGIVVQKAFKMGYLGVMETVRMLKGKPYDENVNSGCQLVTPENMYSSEIEKLIFPFNVLGAD